jgi:hypothetical protein
MDHLWLGVGIIMFLWLMQSPIARAYCWECIRYPFRPSIIRISKNGDIRTRRY